jgi:sugar/nucleoside kinase (ribokinase family)
MDVLGLGCSAVDDLLYLPAFPTPEIKLRVSRRERQCGGLTATGLVAASRLGANAAYAGILADDADSQFVLESLERENVDTQYVCRRPGARPIHSTILVDESRLTRTILFDLTGSTGADPSWPPEAVIRATKVLYVDHYGIEGMTRAARIARAAGIAVVADFERNEWPGFDDLLALVDHLIVSQAFAEKLTGHDEPAKAVAALWRADRQAVIVTCGEHGCWYRGPGDSAAIHHPAFVAAVVDPTGCGDVFHGAYAAALARGMSLAERIRFASAAAAIKAMHRGGQAGIPTRAAVESWMSAK